MCNVVVLNFEIPFCSFYLWTTSDTLLLWYCFRLVACKHRNSDKCCCMRFPSIQERGNIYIHIYICFPGSSAGKESTCNAGNPGLLPGWWRSSGEGIGHPLQYSRASLVAQCRIRLQCGRPGFERSPGGGHGNQLQYSCLENPHGQRCLMGYSP